MHSRFQQKRLIKPNIFTNRSLLSLFNTAAGTYAVQLK